MARVIKRLKGNDGNPIRTSSNNNPMLDTSEYLVQFTDGTQKELHANTIAESMFSQIDSEGRHYQILTEITDHKSDDTAMKKKDGFYTRKGSDKVAKRTTRGWKLQVEWKDGSSSWVPLKDLKLSNPLEVAEYAICNKIEEEPAFKWWVKPTIRSQNRMINKVKTKYWRTTHKFGIRVPKSVKGTIRIDDANGNTLWYDAILKIL